MRLARWQGISQYTKRKNKPPKKSMVFLYTNNVQLKFKTQYHLYVPGTILNMSQIPTHLILKNK